MFFCKKNGNLVLLLLNQQKKLLFFLTRLFSIRLRQNASLVLGFNHFKTIIMKKQLLLMVISLGYFGLGGCEKSNSSTDIGNGDFFLNGERWVASPKGCSEFNMRQVGTIYRNSNSFKNGLDIQFGRCFRALDKPVPDSWEMTITIKNFPAPGTYICNQKIPSNNSNIGLISLVSSRRSPLNGLYTTSEIAQGTITITRVDTGGVNRRPSISGTFECKLKNYENKNDSISITKGSFNISN